MRVLVTGGAGYIGSVTARSMLDAGYEVVVYDSLERGHAKAVDARAELVVADIGDRDALKGAVAGCEAVIHLAGLIEVAESQREPDRYFDVNSIRPLALLEAAADEGCGVVFSSTAAVYGQPDTVPITEDAPTRPINAYGESKLRFEESLAHFGRERGLRSVRVRYFNASGAWPDGSLGEAHDPESHLIPRVLGALASGQRTVEIYGRDYPTPDGTCVRDYVHVCDLAQAHLLAVRHLAAGGEGGAFNLGNGRGFSNLEVVAACCDVVGVEADVVFGPARAGDPPRLVASADRAREILGWSPTRGDVRQMIADAWSWHSTHPNGFK